MFALIFISGFVIAVPPEPMAFYGGVTYNNNPIPNGYYLTAKIDGNINGQCEIINGDYGKGQNDCIIVSHSTSQIQTVEFFLGNNKLGEYFFKAKEIVNLNFTTESLPENFVPLSNGICEP